MAKSLIIVESPAKTKTLKNFLGTDFAVEASMGHVRDLPQKKIGVDVKNDFQPTYVPLEDRGDVLKKLISAAKGVKTIYLASDPDREGEAIAWHLAEALGLKNPIRIQFNEITRQAVEQAIANPRTLNMDRVNAQQARRVLDRLIGYKLSPILNKKIQKGTSAGRVQSVAVRLICDREREIRAFVPQEYWSLTATLTPQKPLKRFPFTAKLMTENGEKLDLTLSPQEQEEESERFQSVLNKATGETERVRIPRRFAALLDNLEGANYAIREVKKRETRRNSAPPFITSTLQQEAARKLGFGNKRTMSVAQNLYEGIDLGAEGSVGLITYMRTDSVRIADEAQVEARKFILEKYGKAYVPATGKQFKSKGSAQDGHEAVRPTSAYREPDAIKQHLNPDQLKLYRLIWQRFVASQMTPAVLDVTTAEIDAQKPTANSNRYGFRASGSIMKFDGFMRVYQEGKDTEETTDEEQPPLPELEAQQPLDLINLDSRQHFTEPPPRYTEATIVKSLEEQGIGRPSTYAAITQTIRDRSYVELIDKRFYPTELGFKVVDSLVKHFPTVMDVKFTADMETRLDKVEDGSENWVNLLRGFYDPFAEAVRLASTEMEDQRPQPIETDYLCSVTAKPMLLRQGRFGEFMGCSGYPECKRILNLNPDGSPIDGRDFKCGLVSPEEGGYDEVAAKDPRNRSNATDHICPLEKGIMLVRQSKRGKFLGCSSFPRCRTTLKLQVDEVTLQDNQEFVCTYTEAGKRGAKKTPAATTKAAATKKAPARKAPATATRSRVKKVV